MLAEISMFFMTGSTVQHPDTVTPSSILIVQGALDATSFRFVYMDPERHFQTSAETRIVSSFATSEKNLKTKPET